MIGRFNSRVYHSPSGRYGHVVMHPSGSVGLFSTAVQFDDEPIVEVPDSELTMDASESIAITGIRFASNRPIPAGMMLQAWNHGNGTVTVLGQIPGRPPVTVTNLPVQGSEVVLPDELFQPAL